MRVYQSKAIANQIDRGKCLSLPAFSCRQYVCDATTPDPRHFKIQTTHRLTLIDPHTGLPPVNVTVLRPPHLSYGVPSGPVRLSYEIDDLYHGRDWQKYLVRATEAHVESEIVGNYVKHIQEDLSNTCHAFVALVRRRQGYIPNP